MPLSDKERQTLDDMERALLLEDPEFVAGASMDQLRARRIRRLVGSAILGVVGAVLLVAGLVLTHAWLVAGVLISVVGVLAMVAVAWASIPRGPRGTSLSRAL